MKLAIFLLLGTVVSVAYSDSPKFIRHIHFTVGGDGGINNGDEATPKIIRQIRAPLGETGTTKGATGGLTSSGAGAGADDIQGHCRTLLTLLKNGMAAGNMSAVNDRIQQFVVVLKRILVMLPPSLQKSVLPIMPKIKSLPQLMKKGAKGTVRTIITQISGTVKEITISRSGGIGAGHEKSQLEQILISIRDLGKAVASGNISNVSTITKELTASMQTMLPKLSPRLRKVLTFCISEMEKIPQLMQTGNKSGAITIITQIGITFVKLMSGGSKGSKGGEGPKNGEGTATGSVSVQKVFVLFTQLRTAIATRNKQLIISISQKLQLSLRAISAQLSLSTTEIQSIEVYIGQLSQIPGLLNRGDIDGILSIITQIEANFIKISGGGGKGPKGGNGTVTGSTSLQEIIILLTKLQTALSSGNKKLILEIYQELTIKLKAVRGNLPLPLRQKIEILVGKLSQLPNLLKSGNNADITLIISIITQLEITLKTAVGGTGESQCPDTIFALLIKVQTYLKAGNVQGALQIIAELIAALEALAPRLPSFVRVTIRIIVQTLTSLQAQLKQGGQTQKALSIIQVIIVRVQKVFASIGSVSNGSKSEIEVISSLLAELEEVSAKGQIQIAISITQTLAIELKQWSTTLSPEAQQIVLTIIVKLKQIRALLEAGKTTGIAIIIDEIEILIQRCASGGGDGAKGKGKGAKVNLTSKQIAEIEAILTKIVGPKLAKVLVDLVVTLINGLLGRVPLRSLLKIVVKLLKNLLGSHGILKKSLGGGNPDAANGGAKTSDGKIKNLTPADQARLIAILSRTVGPYTARTVVKLLATIIDGLLGKLPLEQILHGVTGLVEKLLSSNGLFGKLLGPGGVGGLLRGLLGGNKGSISKGSRSQLTIIFNLLIQLKSAVTAGNTSLVAQLVQQLVIVLKRFLAVLPPGAQETIFTIIELLNTIPGFAKSGSTASVKEIIQKIEILIRQLFTGSVKGGGAKVGGAKGGGKNLTREEILEIEAILTQIVGPKLAKVVTELVVTLVNGLLNGVPLRGLLQIVVKLLKDLLKPSGLINQLLGGGNAHAAGGKARCKNGKLINLTLADQERLIKILSRVLGKDLPRTVVKLIATLVNGLLCGLPLNQILHSITGLVGGLLGKDGLLGGLVGPHGLGGLLGGLLGR